MSVHIPEGKVIVEVWRGLVGEVHAPEGIAVVIVEHELLEEADADELAEVIAATRDDAEREAKTLPSGHTRPITPARVLNPKGASDGRYR